MKFILHVFYIQCLFFVRFAQISVPRATNILVAVQCSNTFAKGHVTDFFLSSPIRWYSPHCLPCWHPGGDGAFGWIPGGWLPQGALIVFLCGPALYSIGTHLVPSPPNHLKCKFLIGTFFFSKNWQWIWCPSFCSFFWLFFSSVFASFFWEMVFSPLPWTRSQMQTRPPPKIIDSNVSSFHNSHGCHFPSFSGCRTIVEGPCWLHDILDLTVTLNSWILWDRGVSPQV